jgi:hypothetical protein
MSPDVTGEVLTDGICRAGQQDSSAKQTTVPEQPQGGEQFTVRSLQQVIRCFFPPCRFAQPLYGGGRDQSFWPT